MQQVNIKKYAIVSITIIQNESYCILHRLDVLPLEADDDAVSFRYFFVVLGSQIICCTEPVELDLI